MIPREQHRRAPRTISRASFCDIDAVDLQRIFEPFEQCQLPGAAAHSDAASHQGTGLGLAISKSLIGAMGGKLNVTSKWQKGSSLHFALALPRAALEDTASPKRCGATGDVSPVRPDVLLGLDILLVEDDALNQMIANEVLANHGAGVTCANDGEQGWEHDQGRSFDLAIVDLFMPRLDGIGLAQRIRGAEGSSGNAIRVPLPMLALTAQAGQGSCAACLASGFDDYLTKPYRMNDLVVSAARLARDAHGTLRRADRELTAVPRDGVGA